MNFSPEYILIQRYILTVLGCMPKTGFRMKKKIDKIKSERDITWTDDNSELSEKFFQDYMPM